jgi:hypothetical protein
LHADQNGADQPLICRTAELLRPKQHEAFAAPKLDPVPLPNKNIENNPMQSSRPVAGMCDASDDI